MCGETTTKFNWLDNLMKVGSAAASGAAAYSTIKAATDKVPGVSVPADGGISDAALATQSKKARQRALSRRSRDTTNLTGGLGVSGPANVGLKQLFGGN